MGELYLCTVISKFQNNSNFCSYSITKSSVIILFVFGIHVIGLILDPVGLTSCQVYALDPSKPPQLHEHRSKASLYFVHSISASLRTDRRGPVSILSMRNLQRYLLSLSLQGALTSGFIDCPPIKCSICIPCTQYEAPGVGFELSTSYG